MGRAVGAGLAGIVFAIYTSAGYSLATVGTELDAIAAVFIGGAAVSGGVGTVVGKAIVFQLAGVIAHHIVG